MSQTLKLNELQSQNPKPRVNFSDENHELHSQLFSAWLPTRLREAPFLDWSRLPGPVMGYFINTVGNGPFAECLALAAAISSEAMKGRSILGFVTGVHRLLRDLQTHCGIQTIDELTKEVWESFFLKTIRSPGGLHAALKKYRTITERYLPGYLEQLTPQQYEQLQPALLPRLPYRFIQQHFSDAVLKEEQRQRRKNKSDILVPLHSSLVALVRFRQQAVERLFQAFQQAKKQVETDQATLPFQFAYKDELVTLNQQASSVAELRLEKRSVTMQFRLWDHIHWVLAHSERYARSYVGQARSRTAEFANPSARAYFVEFLGPAEDLLWIGEIVKYGLWHLNAPWNASPLFLQQRKALLQELGISNGIACSRAGLVTPGLDLTRRLTSAMFRTEALLFDPESLYRGTLYAAALATLALTNGSRMSELLQVSADRFKMRPYTVRENASPGETVRVMRLQWLLPKGKSAEQQRKLYLISDGAYQLLGEIAQELRNAHQGSIPVAHPHPTNKKAEDLAMERYLFQWDADADGRWGALSPTDGQSLLRFVLYGVALRTKQGEAFSVSAHLLRHVMATVARHEHEVPPIAVARALHHELHPGAIPEATEYYSQETEEHSLLVFAAFQTTVEEYAASLLVHWPGEQEIEQMDENLRASFERWHTLLETTLGYCGNVDLCPRGYNRTLCIGCPHLVPDPRKRQHAVIWRLSYAKNAAELEAAGNTIDARQFRLLVRDLDAHINEMDILQASIEDGARKPSFLQLPSANYDTVVIDAEA